MKDLLEIRKFITERLATERLVLCTLIGKRGSSYRSPGAKKVISLSGLSVGLLSGGCLEASIEKSARERFDELPFTLTFDMLSDDDRLLGYQTGCQGAIDIKFEKIDSHAELDELVPFDPVELVLIGCGADADAFSPLARSMGWQVKFLDYRRDLTTRFGDEAVHAKLTELADLVPQGPRVAVVLMTHNYESDLEILRGLRSHNVGYLGCLGPAQRFLKLEEDLLKIHGCTLEAHLRSRVKAPVGVFSNSRSPEEIALSVVAEIQRDLVENLQRRIWTVILAAGASSRFGSPKALAKWKTGTFLSQAEQTARAFAGERVLVVTGANRDQIAPRVASHEFNNMNWQQGMSSSIRAGVERVLTLDPAAEGVVILPVDQPLVNEGHLRLLVEESDSSKRCALTSGAAEIGPPAFIPKRFFNLIAKLEGDRGLKSVLSPSQFVCCENQLAFQDFDSTTQLAEESL